MFLYFDDFSKQKSKLTLEDKTKLCCVVDSSLFSITKWRNPTTKLKLALLEPSVKRLNYCYTVKNLADSKILNE